MAGSHNRRRSVGMRKRGGAVATASVAVVSAAVLGISPAAAAIAPTYYVRGTNIGGVPPEDVHRAWVDGTVEMTVGPHGAPTKVNYPGGFWPVSKGYLGDPTYGKSVGEGFQNLGAAILADGHADAPVIIHGYSQGAVVATEYMRANPGAGNIYVLAANPNRPNGGVLARFSGLYIPILDVSFNGSTPTDDEIVIDIARQYDGWADFPKYPLNLLATANALLGIAYLHGRYPEAVTPEVLAGLTPTAHGNTSYYLVPTERLPLLMPFSGILPDQLLDALDAPLRALVELGYDRSDYGQPTGAGLWPTRIPPTVALAEVTTADETSDGTQTGQQVDEPDELRRSARTSNNVSEPADTTSAEAGEEDINKDEIKKDGAAREDGAEKDAPKRDIKKKNVTKKSDADTEDTKNDDADKDPADDADSDSDSDTTDSAGDSAAA